MSVCFLTVTLCVYCCAQDCGFISIHLWRLILIYRLYLCFILLCLYLPGLVHGPEPNPQQTRKEEAFRGRHPDEHQSDGVRPACSTRQEQQQVDIHLYSLFIILPPNIGDDPDSWVYPFFKECLYKKGWGKKTLTSWSTGSNAKLYHSFHGRGKHFATVCW